jgi:hypothetical protein
MQASGVQFFLLTMRFCDRAAAGWFVAANEAAAIKTAITVKRIFRIPPAAGHS